MANRILVRLEQTHGLLERNPTVAATGTGPLEMEHVEEESPGATNAEELAN
jgi:hypothetical protein